MEEKQVNKKRPLLSFSLKMEEQQNNKKICKEEVPDVFSHIGEDPLEEEFTQGWTLSTLMQKSKQNPLQLEDVTSASHRLEHEGVILAEAQKYRQALERWQRALNLTPLKASIFEMRAQVFLELDQVFDAVQSATKSVELEPNKTEYRLTLARAQIGLGELSMAKENLKTVLDKCTNEEVRKEAREDFFWVEDLLEKKRKIEGEHNDKRKFHGIEFPVQLREGFVFVEENKKTNLEEKSDVEASLSKMFEID